MQSILSKLERNFYNRERILGIRISQFAKIAPLLIIGWDHRKEEGYGWNFQNYTVFVSLV